MFILKRAVSHSAAFSIPAIASRFVAVAMLPIYTSYLSTADYGILELLDLTLTVFTALCGVQLSSALYYFFTSEEEERRLVVSSTALVGAAVIGITAAAIGALNAEWIGKAVFQSGEHTFALRLYFSSLAFSLLAEAALNQLRVTQRVALWNVVTVSRLVLQASLNVVFLAVFGLGYFSILWGNLIAAAAVGLILPIFFFREIPLVFDLRLFGRMVRYSLPVSISGLGMLFLHYGDRFFLGRAVSLSQLGLYGLAYKIGMMSTVAHGPFVTYWMVDQFNVLKGKDGERNYVLVFTYLTLVLCASGVALAVFCRPIITLLSAQEFHGAAVYVPWIAFAYVIRSLGDHVRSVFFTENKTIKNTTVTIVGVVVCAIAYSTLIMRFGVWGAVASTLITFTVWGLFGFAEAQKTRYCRFEYKRLGKIALAVIVSCAPMLYFRPESFVVQCLQGGLQFIVFVAVLFLAGFLTTEEKSSMRAFLATVRARLRERRQPMQDQ